MLLIAFKHFSIFNTFKTYWSNYYNHQQSNRYHYSQCIAIWWLHMGLGLGLGLKFKMRIRSNVSKLTAHKKFSKLVCVSFSKTKSIWWTSSIHEAGGWGWRPRQRLVAGGWGWWLEAKAELKKLKSFWIFLSFGVSTNLLISRLSSLVFSSECLPALSAAWTSLPRKGFLLNVLILNVMLLPVWNALSAICWNQANFPIVWGVVENSTAFGLPIMGSQELSLTVS